MLFFPLIFTTKIVRAFYLFVLYRTYYFYTWDRAIKYLRSNSKGNMINQLIYIISCYISIVLLLKLLLVSLLSSFIFSLLVCECNHVTDIFIQPKIEGCCNPCLQESWREAFEKSLPTFMFHSFNHTVHHSRIDFCPTHTPAPLFKSLDLQSLLCGVKWEGKSHGA